MATSPSAPPSKRFLSIDTVADLAWGVGFRGEGLVNALAVASAESRLDAHASLVNTAALGSRGKYIGSVDRGLLQINNVAHPGVSDAQAYDPVANLRTGYTISSGGNSWTPWTTYKEGLHRKYLTEARAAADARAGIGGTGSIGAPPAGQMSAGVSHDVVTAAAPLPTAYVAPLSINDIQVGGAGLGGAFSPGTVLGGQVDLSTDEVSQVTLELLNLDGRLVGNVHNSSLLTAPMEWGPNLKLQVAAIETGPGPEGGVLTVTGRSQGAQALKSKYPGTPTGRKDISPTEYAALFAGRHLLRFHGEGSPRRPDITPAEVGGGFETTWAVLQRLADDLDWLVFEAGGILHFGSAVWLAARGTEVTVVWPPNGDTSAHDVPVIRGSMDDPRDTSVSVQLPRWRGELIRPGMRLRLTWGTTADYLINRVSWSVDGGLGPVTVEAFIPEPARPKSTEVTQASRSEIGTADGGAAAGGARPEIGTGDGGAAAGGATSSGFQWPTIGRVSSEFGDRGGRLHAGIDIAAPTGTPVHAAQAGKVTRASFSSSYGNVVYVDHGTVETRYAHNVRLTCSVGDQVGKGQKIAEVGSTGRSSGPHCHFEIRPGGSPKNPRRHIAGEPGIRGR